MGWHPEQVSERLDTDCLFRFRYMALPAPVHSLVSGTQGRLRNPVVVQTFGEDGTSHPYPKDG